MAIEAITAERLELKRGSALVCIPADATDQTGSADERMLATVQSVLAHTGSSSPVLIVGVAARIERVASELPVHLRERAILSLELKSGANETQAVNAAARASFPGDLVLVAPGVRVTTDWFERLRAAALSDSTIASATPLSLGAGALALDDDDRFDRVDPPANIEIGASPQPDSPRAVASPIGKLARKVSEHSLRLRPRVATIGPACAYIRRAALELAGPLDETLSLDEALADLAVRAIAAGMVHVAADDVLVGGPSGRGAGAGARRSPSPLRADGQVSQTLLDDEQGRLRRAIGVAGTALRRLSVTIDGRTLTSAVGGTQTYIIELIMALAREGNIAVRVLVAPDLSRRAAEALATLSDVELLTYEQAINRPRLTDVVHRPQAVFTPDDLTLLRLLGKRVIIGQLDLIAYHNYSYHRDLDDWRAYRRTTRLALGGADQVIFFSEHARRDALAEDLLPEGRTHVVSVGAEVLEPTSAPGTPPGGLMADPPFLLCLGADYAHKNRYFAMELLGALRELGWIGRLVLAGAHVPFGSSRERERELLRSRPDLAQFIVDLGPVDESSKKWLFRHARALVYPTLYEGFGLLPLEAARADLPCLFASQASLSEVAGRAATLVAWDARASAVAVFQLLSDGPPREEHLANLHAHSIPAWGDVAHRLVAVYEQAVAAPPSEAAPRMWQELDRENHLVRLDQDIGHLKTLAQEYQDAYHALEARVATGLPLIDEGGLLNHAQQRGLMRVAARGRLGALLLAPFGLLGRRAATNATNGVPDSPDVTQ
jgi:glycosyltransferase involved in cell wall biosynthesis